MIKKSGNLEDSKGRKIYYDIIGDGQDAIIFAGGLMSDKEGSKAIAFEKSAIKAASAEIMSIIGGQNTDGALSKKWNEEVLAKRAKLIAELPGIGAATAKKIMAVAKDIMGLCTMSEYELTQIDGVSSIQAKGLHKFLHG